MDLAAVEDHHSVDARAPMVGVADLDLAGLVREAEPRATVAAHVQTVPQKHDAIYRALEAWTQGA